VLHLQNLFDKRYKGKGIRSKENGGAHLQNSFLDITNIGIAASLYKFL
jgi:hypothetical protein